MWAIFLQFQLFSEKLRAIVSFSPMIRVISDWSILWRRLLSLLRLVFMRNSSLTQSSEGFTKLSPLITIVTGRLRRSLHLPVNGTYICIKLVLVYVWECWGKVCCCFWAGAFDRNWWNSWLKGVLNFFKTLLKERGVFLH